MVSIHCQRLLAVLVSEGSVTSRTPVRNKQTPKLTCLLTPEHLGRGRTVHEPDHTSTTIGYSIYMYVVLCISVQKGCVELRNWTEEDEVHFLAKRKKKGKKPEDLSRLVQFQLIVCYLL